MAKSTKPTEEFRCRHCQGGAVEFDVSNIYRVDNFGQRLNERTKREVRCVLCGALAVVVKLDPTAVIEEERMKQFNPNIPDTVNQTFVEEQGDNRREQPVNLTKLFQGAGNSPLSLGGTGNGNLTPLEEFKSKFKGF